MSGDSAVNGGPSEPASESDLSKVNAEQDSFKAEPEQTDEKSKDVKVKEESTEENVLTKSEDICEEPPLEVDQTEHGKESIEIPIQKEEAKAGAEGNSAATIYKDNKDVVLREDLKKVFQKFGFVKVKLWGLSCSFYGAQFWIRFTYTALAVCKLYCYLNYKVNGFVLIGS